MKCSYKKCDMNVYIDGSENLLLHLKGIIEYVLPKPNEKFCVNSSTDENDTSEKGDFELTNTEEAVHDVEVPYIPKHWRQVWNFFYDSFFCVNSVTYLIIDVYFTFEQSIAFSTKQFVVVRSTSSK